MTAILRKFTKIPRKLRARNQERLLRKLLQDSNLAQIPRRNNDNTSVPQHHSLCQKELPKVFLASNKRKRSRSLEEGDNLISESAQPLPTASQLSARRELEDIKWAASRAIVVQDHNRTVPISQPRTDHNQSLALTDYTLESSIINPISVDHYVELKEIECKNQKRPTLVTAPHGTYHSAL